MAKSQKELAFLRDLYVNEAWTRRFTDLIDQHFKFADSENLLYINAGTGDHSFVLQEKIGETTDIIALCENEDLLRIAREKAAALRSGVDFSTSRFDDGSFDAVLADASFTRPGDYPALIEETVRTAKTGANIGIIFVTAGSFGEVFSLLWEVLFNEDLGEHGVAAERMISEQPSVSNLEDMAKRSGLINVKTHLAKEVFEYENGVAFIYSPLIEDFLLPVWLEMLNEDEKASVREKLAELIDAEDGDLSFRFSVKATLLTGKKG
jgi:ubiquinone/menaquinone biosynthesis C-methylase UbiE